MIRRQAFARRLATAAIVPSLLAVPTHLAAAPAPALEPGQWISDWGDQRCALVRRSRKDPSATLIVRSRPDAKSVNFAIARADWKSRPLASPGPGSLVLEPGGQVVEGRLIDGEADGAGRLIEFTATDHDFIERLERATSATLVNRAGKPEATIDLPQFPKALASLRGCLANVHKRWGADPAALAALSRPPQRIGDIDWIDSSEYPNQALRDRAQGDTVIRFTVDPQGRVADCAVVVPSGQPHRRAHPISCADGSQDRPAARLRGRPRRHLVAMTRP